MHRAFLAVLALFVLLTSVPTRAETLELIGASTVAREIIAPLAEPFKKSTNVEIKLHAVGTGKGMIALFQGKAKAAMTSESLEDALYTTQQVAQKEGIALSVPPNLSMTRLGQNRLMVIVHRDNPVVALTRTQIKDIFTGKIRNWKELGGDDMPIQAITSVLGNAIRTVIQRRVMDGEAYQAGIRETGIPGEAIPIVAGEKGAVAVVSLSGWSGQFANTHAINTPELSHPLGLVTIGPPDARMQRLIGFIRANSRI